jgi:hypothetical protein
VKAFGVLRRLDTLENGLDLRESLVTQGLSETIESGLPVRASIEIPEGHAEGSSRRFRRSPAANSALLAKSGIVGASPVAVIGRRSSNAEPSPTVLRTRTEP